MKWYSLRVISGKEKVAKENIMFDAEEHNLDEFISEIFVPFEKVIEMKNNKKRLKRNFFSRLYFDQYGIKQSDKVYD